MELTVSEDGADCVVREVIDEGVGYDWVVSGELCEGEFLSANSLENVVVLVEVVWVEAKNVNGTEWWLICKVVSQLSGGRSVW